MIRDKYIHFRANESEISFIKDSAQKRNLNMTDYIKTCCGLPSYLEVKQDEQEELEEFERQHKNDYEYCSTPYEIKLEEQEILEEYERLCKEYDLDYVESCFDYKQREQEELDNYVTQQEDDDFELFILEFENEFKKKVEDERLTFDEIRLLQDSIDRCKEFYEQKLDEIILSEKELTEIY